MTIYLFAGVRERFGAPTVQLECPGEVRIADLRRMLEAKSPGISTMLARSRFAVNHEIAEEDRIVQPGDEIAVIPPVSGG